MSVHCDITCDNCHVISFTGIRYKCYTCPNYNLCDQCIDIVEEQHLHDDQHTFLRLQHTPTSTPTSVTDPDIAIDHVTLSASSPTRSSSTASTTIANMTHVYTDRSTWHHQQSCETCQGAIIGYRYFCPSCCMSFCAQCEFNRGTAANTDTDRGGHDVSHSLLKMSPPSPPDSLSTTRTVAHDTTTDVAATVAATVPVPPPPRTLADYGVTVSLLKVWLMTDFHSVVYVTSVYVTLFLSPTPLPPHTHTRITCCCVS